MSNTPIRPIPIMKAIFAEPRATQGRNFLMENKVSLHLLEKSTSEKLAAKEPVRPKWMPAICRQGPKARESKAGRPPVLVSRRNNQKISVKRNSNNSHSHHPLCVTVPESDLEESNPVLHDPSEETQEEIVQSPDTYSTSTGIQTDDITDVLYLTNALKKCSFDGISMQSNQYDNNEDEDLLLLRTNGKQHSCLNMKELNTMPLPDDDLKTEVSSNEEGLLSAHSRFTVATKASNASTKSITSKCDENKLGSRDQLRLPRYLEKEKREKGAAAAATKKLADTRAPDCRRGHMPITAQTLSVRSRNAEIGKGAGYRK
ncbi:uncharacterized protein LOC108165607 [Drosophila miranda]|uniref:uncharacterized protein LOC108165607 n=1 Tax=Drosophila miranda TaxID=7229 RepID=UPI0007E76D68|nr:uncharacterized protein LOC108165607 [Drosophila miranda]